MRQPENWKTDESADAMPTSRVVPWFGSAPGLKLRADGQVFWEEVISSERVGRPKGLLLGHTSSDCALSYSDGQLLDNRSCFRIPGKGNPDLILTGMV